MSGEAAGEAGLDAPRMRRPLLLLGAVAGAAALAVGLWIGLRDGSGGGAAAAETVSTTTAVVSRRNLAETETFSGTLGHADQRTVVAQLQGTVTSLPGEGSVVRRGRVLYRVDDRPVVVMYGALPAWRTLRDGLDDGRDVRQLEWNLVALGFDTSREITIDTEWTSATTAAVERWQESLGVEETGVVELGSVVFLSGERRVGRLLATVGSPVQSGVQVLQTSSTVQEVTLDLETTRQSLVAVGRRVSVGLPDGSTIPGMIARVGTVAETPASTGTSGATEEPPTIEVSIRLLRRPGVSLDQAPVDVELTTESRRNVLAVPITALVALLGGGYAVEVDRGGTTELVRVTPGLYASGYVEVTGELREGDRVVVPQ